MRFFNEKKLTDKEVELVLARLLKENEALADYAEKSCELLKKLSIKIKRLEEKAYFIEEDF